ncbi:MAG: hypothetical protein ABJ201_09755, partial [Nisaea sp.]
MHRLSILLGGLNFALVGALALEWVDSGYPGTSYSTIALGLAAAALVCALILLIKTRRAESLLGELRNSRFQLGALFEHSPI